MPYSLHTAGYRYFMQMLVAARKARSMSQAQLAQRLGKPQSFVSKYERGERRVDVVEFILIADSLGIDIGHFLADYRRLAGVSLLPPGA